MLISFAVGFNHFLVCFPPPLNFVLHHCSSCRYYVEKSRKGKTPVSRRSGRLRPAASMGDLFIVSVSMIAEKLRLAKQSEGYGAPELSRYLAVYFDYSSESDIPTMLTLASRYSITLTLRSSRHKSICCIFPTISGRSQKVRHGEKTYTSRTELQVGKIYCTKSEAKNRQFFLKCKVIIITRE